MATVAVGDVSLPPANPEQTQTEKAPRVGVNLLGLVPLVKKLFKKKSVPLETPKSVPAPSPESTPCALDPVVFEIEVRETAGGPVLETHQVRANGECSWHNVSEKLKFAEERYITVKTKFLDPVCSRNAYYDNIRIRIMDIPEVLQQNHYYPFGMNMTGIEEDDKQTLSSLEENMYQYNGGSEKRTSLNLHWYETKFRAYDMQLGRFHKVDPLADHEAQFDKSPYAYSWNNPVNLNDPDGDIPPPLLGAAVGAGVGAIAGAVVAALEGGDATDIAIGAASGAVGGAIIGSGAGLVTSLGFTGTNMVVTSGLTGFFSGAAENATQQGLEIATDKRKEFSKREVTYNAVTGAAVNTFAGPAANLMTQQAKKKVGSKVAQKTAEIKSVSNQQRVKKTVIDNHNGIVPNAKKLYKKTKKIVNQQIDDATKSIESNYKKIKTAAETTFEVGTKKIQNYLNSFFE